ncbi:MAG TPA: HD-GYP domain-containing protein, partial [Actinobacteria bacterium]|nr:HD-GYP domain-containing protein [Actinomycetes bacterium]HEX21620.1 HD-GYP domain-containing protein [Actinomycetota bacterium]
LFDLALTKLDAIFKNIPIDNIVNLNEAEVLVNSLIEGILENNQTLTALTSLKKFNNYTCRHSINVTILSLLLAIELGLTDNELLTIGTGALLHDIGKLKIPIEIIDKKSSLTSAEWALVKNHPIKGFDIICDLPGLDRMIPVIAYEHHLGFDLSGYPATKRIEKPHLFSRLVQIADAYDGATAHRSYHNAASPSIVLASMYKKSGSLFDPTLLRLFIKTIGLYPIGSLVRLSNGQVGIVAETNTDDISCPRVKIIADQGGLKSSDYLLDTVNGNHSKGPSILGFADPEIYKINDDYSLLKVI